MSYTSPILPGIAELAPQMIELRHLIHAHPELAFEEFHTSDKLAELLTAWGYQVTRGLGGTGLVATLKVGNGTKSLGLRADMDALPITEATGLPYTSTHPGKMHACGHDGHTAMLMCAAAYLAKSRSFSGTLNLIFQPAEENFGGAKAMIDDGLFERFPCDAVFAMHNMPGTSAGKLAFRTGAAMASSDRVTITLTGIGGHGAMPHRARDPLPAAASIVLGLQSIVAREVDAQQAAVVTVGSLHAGGDVFNVIPETAVMKLSVRALDAEVREQLRHRIQALVQAQAQSFGLTAQIDYDRGYPVLVNHAEETAFARQVALELVGAEQVICETPPLMGSEDFAYMLQVRPGCYLYIGNGEGSEGGCMVHNPGYDFNDAILPLGASYWVRLAEAYLAD